MPRRRTIRSGGCRSGGPTTRCWNCKVADINNVGSGGQAGAITAALFIGGSSDGEVLDAFRRFRLEPAPAGTARRRRMPGRARALCAAGRALRLNVDTMRALDPRLTPARADLAAKELEGKVAAARFVEGRAYEVIEPQAPLRARRARRAALYRGAQGRAGHDLRQNAEGWAWGQLAADGYVGWLAGERAGAGRPAADPQGHGAAHLRLSGSVDQAAAA